MRPGCSGADRLLDIDQAIRLIILITNPEKGRVAQQAKGAAALDPISAIQKFHLGILGPAFERSNQLVDLVRRADDFQRTFFGPRQRPEMLA